MSKTTHKARQPRGKPPLSPELRQAVWDEAIRAISGGFAHDANNCLTGIFSMSDLCLAQVEPENPLHESLSLMRDSASQASQLLQRLSRLIYDTPGAPTYCDLNELTAEACDILRRVLPRSTDLRVDLYGRQLAVFVDPVELRQVFICLALGASKGDSEAWAVTISTRSGAPPVGAVSLSIPNPCLSVLIGGSFSRRSPGLPDSSALDKGDKWTARLAMARNFAERHGGALALDHAGLHLCLPPASLGSDA